MLCHSIFLFIFAGSGGAENKNAKYLEIKKLLTLPNNK